MAAADMELQVRHIFKYGIGVLQIRTRKRMETKTLSKMHIMEQQELVLVFRITGHHMAAAVSDQLLPQPGEHGQGMKGRMGDASEPHKPCREIVVVLQELRIFRRTIESQISRTGSGIKKLGHIFA